MSRIPKAWEGTLAKPSGESMLRCKIGDAHVIREKPNV